jgi:hypothetical protein
MEISKVLKEKQSRNCGKHAKWSFLFLKKLAENFA